MSYLGQGPFQEFTNPPTKDSFTGDGSTTTFDLAKAVPAGSQYALEVYVNNVRQEPGSGKAFTLGVDGSGDHKRITFSTAPASSAVIYVINDKTNTTTTAPAVTDLNGVELILDVDGDTSITADTDDRIDFKLGNVEHISINNSSGDTVIKPMVDAKDILFQQYDGRTLLDINDGGYVAITNGATGPGQLRLYEDTDLGTNYSAFQVGTQSGDITYTLPTADGSANQQLTTNGSGTLSWANQGANPISADGDTLGTASLEWSDLYLADSSTIQFGNDQDTILTHTDGTGLTLNSTNKLCFNDASQFIQGASATVLDIAATDEIELTATLIDVVGNFTNSGTIVSAGVVTAAGFTIGSAVIGEAELEILDGATVTTAELNLIDGGTSRGTTAVASGDGILINDAGTMAMTNVDTVSTYFASHSVGGGNIVTTGALDSGSITSGFGAIDNGTSGIRTNTFTVETSVVPDAQDGAALGTSSLQFSDLFLADGAVISFGDDNEITLTHVADDGLVLKHVGTGDGKEPSLTFQAGDDDIAVNDVLGSIFFQAPDEGAGTDAIAVAAGIEAVAEGDFSSSSNATSLVFKTGASEAATAKVKITSAGHLVPNADDTYDLGTGSLQWRNIYTGDLNLSNMSKTKGNKVDGTKGNWTVQEGDKDLYLINNNSGKKYKFNLTEI